MDVSTQPFHQVEGVTQGAILKWSTADLNSEFSFSWMVALAGLKNAVYLTIYSVTTA